MSNQSDFTLSCPTLTFLEHDTDTDHWSCEYQEWAYALFASLTAIAGLIPLMLLICFWAKWKNRRCKGTLSRQDSPATTRTSASNLYTDGSRFFGSLEQGQSNEYNDYEVIHGNTRTPSFSPFVRPKGLEHLGYDYGTFSAPVLSHMDQACGDNSGHPCIPKREHHPDMFYSLPTDIEGQPAEKGVDCIQKPCVNEDGTMNRNSYQGIAFARGMTSVGSTGNNRRAKQNENRSATDTGESRCSCHNAEGSLSNYYGDYPDELEKLRNAQNSYNSQMDQPSSQNQHFLHSQSSLHNQCSPLNKSLVRSSTDHQTIHNGINEGKAPSYQATPSSYQATPPSYQATPPTKHLVDRWDFDQYLLDCVSKLPEDQRNGSFLIRDSQTYPDCKVLTLYYRVSERPHSLCYYKIRYNDGNIFIVGSKEAFRDLDKLINFYRSNISIMPCLLADCMGKNF